MFVLCLWEKLTWMWCKLNSSIRTTALNLTDPQNLCVNIKADCFVEQDCEHPHLSTQLWRVFDGKKWISDAKLTLCATIEKKQSEGEHVDFSEINGAEEGTLASTGGVSV